MNAMQGLPLGLRLVLVALVGVAGGAIVNAAVRFLLGDRAPPHPWFRELPRRADASLWDLAPVVGWWRLRGREAGPTARYGLRPLVVELSVAALCVGLYWWEVDQLGLLPPKLAARLFADPAVWARMHSIFLSHVVLVLLMATASLVDIDERIIPDGITIPGTLLGLFLAAALPNSALPIVVDRGPAGFAVTSLSLASPDDWPPALAAAPNLGSLALGVGCYLAWCLALVPRLWAPRRGWRKAVALAVAYVVRTGAAFVVGLLAVAGALGVAFGWWLGDMTWQGLLSSLVGLVVGGGLVWSVRVVGSLALGREAMGFGDVTLLAMIGTFVGWQPCLIIFFLAPFAGLVVGVSQWLLNRRTEIPYGPFLCLATLTTIFLWADLWAWIEPLFAIPGLVPIVLLACVVALGFLLGLWRLVAGRR